MIKLFDHLIFHIVNDDFPVVKYSEILLHGFRMANFGHEMADGQLLCYATNCACVHTCVYIDLLVCAYVQLQWQLHYYNVCIILNQSLLQ